jgi:hypothetical protein
MIFGADVRVALLPRPPLASVSQLLEQFAYILVHLGEDIPCGIFLSFPIGVPSRSPMLVMQEPTSELSRTSIWRTSENTPCTQFCEQARAPNR